MKRAFLSCIVVACLLATARADTTSGLLVYLRMDETNGLTAADTTTNAHNAVLTNFLAGNAQWVSGKTNGALNFNAATNNQRAIIGDASGALNFGAKTKAAFTLAMWVKGGPASQSPGAGILAKGTGRGGEQFAMDVYNNAFRFFVRSSNGTSYLLAPGVAVDGTWQHLVGTCETTNANSGMKFYINGQLLLSGAAPGALTNTLHEISLGSREDNPSSGYNLPFYGALDDVRIYDRALSANDVLELFQSAGAPPVVPEAEFVALRSRWRDILNGGTNLNTADPDAGAALTSLANAAQGFWSTMDTSANHTFVWSDLANLATDSGQIWFTYDRLKTMSLALCTPGTPLFGNSALRADTLAALDWMYANIYNETKTEYGNWWHWEIGVPLRLNDITVLLYDSLSGQQVTNYMNAVNKFSPAPNGTAANLVWKATVVGLRGAIVKDSSKIFSATASLSTVFPYVTNGDGFYQDGSFIQHSYHPYTGSYGSSLIGYLAPVLHLVNGSRWDVTDSRLTNVFQWVYQAYQPVTYKGAIMDMVRGRAISRDDETDRIIGHATIAAILRLAEFAPVTDAAAFRSMAKSWIQSDTMLNFVANSDPGTIPLVQALLANPSIEPPAASTHYTFASMDRVVHCRPTFAFGISMYSSRIATYESINNENLHGWFTAYGMTYLYNSDLGQFSESFWPSIDPYRLPGTTVDRQQRSDSSGSGYRSGNRWVGGATLGAYGVAGMHLAGWNSNLGARKSWFMFDDEIVCLGAGITCTSNRSIETIVENRKLTPAGDNVFTVNGIAQPTSLGWAQDLQSVSWAHLQGKVPGADIGYYFPEGPMVKATREERSGRWYDLNHTEYNSMTNVTRDYLALWYDHGTNPVNAVYSYVLLPGKSGTETEAYALHPAVSVVQNDSVAQGVAHGPLGIRAANFWTDSTQTVCGLTLSGKGSVLVQLTETNLALALGDPTQTNSAGLWLSVAQGATQLLCADPAISVDQLSPGIRLTVNTANSAGRTFLANFACTVTNFSMFQQVHFTPAQIADPAVSGPDADPDHDGLSNAMEYALVQDPWGSKAMGLEATVSSGHLQLTYNRRKAAADLAYSVDISNDLRSWDTSGSHLDQTVISDQGLFQTVRVADNVSIGSGENRYYRLRVTLRP